MLKTVTSENELIEMVEHIKFHDKIAYDTETTGLNTRKDKMIGFSVCGSPGVSFYLPILEWNLDRESLEIIPLGYYKAKEVLRLLTTKKVICHNASFDISITKNNFNIDLLPSLHCDTVLLKHTVDEEYPFGLKEIAMKIQHHLGMNMYAQANQEQIELKEHLKQRGASTTKKKYELYKGDKFIIGKYAARDTDLTMRIYQYYYKILKDKDLEGLFLTETMPLCRSVVIPMENKGIPIDVLVAQKAQSDINRDLHILENKVQKELDVVAKEYITSLLDTKYPVSNKGGFVQFYCRLNNLHFPETPKGSLSITKKSIKEITNKTHLEFLTNGTGISDEQKVIIQKQLHFKKNPGYKHVINLNSKKELSELVFGFLGEVPLSKTKKGNDQFNDAVVQSLAKKYVWASILSDYNKLTKLKNSYIDKIVSENEDGVWYARFKQHGTVSGRLSGDAQQLPRPKESNDEIEYSEVVLKYTNLIRSFIIAPTGYKLIITDYSSLEPTVFSHSSNDDGLRKIFKEGLDFYSEIAIKIFKLQGVSSNKEDANFLKKVNPEKRKKTKGPALGIPYGMTAFKLSKDQNIDIEEAENTIDNYMSSFPDLYEMMKNSRAEAKTNGFVKTELGRIRNLPRVKELYSLYGDNLLDFKYRRKMMSYLEEDEVKKMYNDYKNGLNNSVNFKVQGMGAHIMNRSGIAIANSFTNENLDATIIMQVHDEYVCLVKDEHVEDACKIIQNAMENTVKISVPLIAKPSVATNYGEGHE